ncbi:23 kDa integral membrane protein-like [Pararge aegeria]|uniref:23 kDa integral membrane protein-like n=1 Tax=Pararge aegeria TaxID=116150 RepID=UPI0019D23EA6|nr:23 kDa integral membrane protein-like [Pararge aegeria]
MCLLSCGACISQILLFALNFLLSLISLAVTGIGIYMMIQVNQLKDSDLEYVNNGPIIVIVVGVIFSAIFFCGCCGAFCRNRCLLTTYGVITILLATATVVFTVFIFKGTDQLQDSAEGVLNDTFSDPQNQGTLNLIEATLGCCGTNGPEYYNSSVPVSCCPSGLQSLQGLQQNSINITDLANSTSGDAINLSCPASEAYQQGCVEVFIQFLTKIFKVTGQVLIWIVIIEYVAAILAIFLSCYIG